MNPSPVTVKAGGTAKQLLKLQVEPGYHVNSDKPPDEFIIPLKLTWEPGAVSVKQILYPKPEDMRVGDQKLTVLTGTFQIQTEFEAMAGAQPATGTINGKLRYQACNNEMCLRPATVDVKVPVTVQ